MRINPAITLPRLGSYPEVVIDASLVHEWGQDLRRKDTAVPDAQGKKLTKYKEATFGRVWP